MKTLNRAMPLFLLYSVSCVLYIGLEWLFFITKPSPFSIVSLSEQLELLLISPLALFIAIFPIGIVLLLISNISFFNKFASVVLLFIPAAIISCSLLLLIDNFTYTFFKINSSSYIDSRRYVYLLGFIILFIITFRRISKVTHKYSPSKTSFSLVVFFICFFSISGYISFTKFSNIDSVETNEHKSTRAYPNILIFSTDGLRASNMSAYGYSRNTTPFIDSLLSESLVFENHFSNNARTTGSVAAMLSGKFPLTTRVIYPPDIFRGEHAYLHLPSLLKKLGYFNRDISMRHYVDAYDLNMINAFDIANDRKQALANSSANPSQRQTTSYELSGLFIKEISDRIFTKLKHLFVISDFKNPYHNILSLKNANYGGDEDRIINAMDFIKSSPRPFFASVHLLNTHGSKFHFRDRFFSKSKHEQPDWDIDFYDDSIRTYDIYVNEIVNLLKEQGIWDNTIFIINSDHGMRWSLDEPLPLIIRFPNSAHTGTIKQNSQRIDIAPTILDFLGVSKPNWMEGVSLISDSRELPRYIFSSDIIWSLGVKEKRWTVVKNPKPPYYTLGQLTLINCNQSFTLDIAKESIDENKVTEHTSPCTTNMKLTLDEAKEVLAKHLLERDYSLPTKLYSIENN